jgi:hypothetical protein
MTIKEIYDNYLYAAFGFILLWFGIFWLINIYIVYEPSTFFLEKKHRELLKDKNDTEIVNTFIITHEKNEELKFKTDSLSALSEERYEIYTLMNERYINMINYYDSLLNHCNGTIKKLD